ncbi:MAG TPA: PHB depolymerase family esterase [Azospirillaceae bacterium]|nr:PHB depolymerase family esterase [Azospirillaceae bacterium]
MNDRFNEGMAEATRLTRAGKLAEATALIRRLMGGDGAAPRPTGARPPALHDPRIIDADYVTVGVEPAAEPEAAEAPRRRSGLGDTLREMAAKARAAQQAHTARAPAPVEVPPGASFDLKSFSDAAGSRRYRLYVPSIRREESLPLVVMLHGCTQTPEDFAAGTGMNRLAEELGFLVAYPEQPRTANQNGCWNWFEAAHQRPGAGEPGLIAGIARQIMRDHRVDPARVFVAGLSAGGAMAAVLGNAHPELFRAVGVHSGLPAGAARDLPGAFAAMRQGGEGAAMRVPAIVFHGDRDGTVSPRNADALLRDAGRGRAEKGNAGGRSYTRHVHTDGTGRVRAEGWRIHGAGHAWSGGSAAGSYADPSGPDASREMLRFFLAVTAAGDGTVS